MTKTEEHVEALIAKASDAFDSADAMRFAQAALNAVNAATTLSNMKRAEQEWAA